MFENVFNYCSSHRVHGATDADCSTQHPGLKRLAEGVESYSVSVTRRAAAAAVGLGQVWVERPHGRSVAGQC